MIVIGVAIVVAFTILGFLPSEFANDTLKVIISIVASALLIFAYKIPCVGYGFKFLTSLVSSYRLLLPAITWLASDFLPEGKLLLVKIGGVLIGAILITKWQIDTTKYTFFDTDDTIDFDHIKYILTKLKFSLPKRKNTYSSAKRATTSNDSYSFRQAQRESEMEMYMKRRELEKERKRIEEMKAQVERERREIYKQKSQENIDFFAGCRSDEEIKLRYRKLVQEYHPDVQRGNAEMFKKIQAEYERLSKR